MVKLIIKNEKNKIEFLKECQDHIARIFDSYLTHDEKIDMLDCLANGPCLTMSENKIAGDLPEYIRHTGWLRNIKMGKLRVLTSIYNEVATARLGSDGIDLKEIYKNVKNDLDDTLNGCGLPNCDELMKSHRRPFLRRTGIICTILRFILTPESTCFLNKTGFFTITKDSSPSSNKEERALLIPAMRTRAL